MTMTLIAATVYGATLGLGVTAAVRRTQFGRWHHVMFFLSCATALSAALVDFSWLHVLPILCLIALPFTKGGRRDHMTIGLLGAISWIVVLLLRTIVPPFTLG